MHSPLIKKILLFTGISLLFTACTLIEKDNTPQPTPLTPFSAEIKPIRLWSTPTGSGTTTHLRMRPALGQTALFTSNTNGTITSVDKRTGHIHWQVQTKLPLTTSPGLSHHLLLVGSRQGHIIALRQQDGALVWQTHLAREILAQPVVAQETVIIKTIDGEVHALSVKNGQEQWTFRQVEPNLILLGSSAPLIHHHHVIIGFANGNLVKASMQDGTIAWIKAMAKPEGAFTIQRMIDIDVDPILFKQRLYAATYQGQMNALDWSGQINWSHALSSYTGMAANQDSIYISDASSHVWSFNANNGHINWQQSKLAARQVSGPAIMNHYVVVGDAEGYLHWLDPHDGHFVAREQVGAPILATPIVENNILYLLTSNHRLMAYQLSS